MNGFRVTSVLRASEAILSGVNIETGALLSLYLTMPERKAGYPGQIAVLGPVTESHGDRPYSVLGLGSQMGDVCYPKP
jgi:hypothetical protein